MSGKPGDVDNSVIDDWIEKLPDLCDGYVPKESLIQVSFFVQEREQILW